MLSEVNNTTSKLSGVLSNDTSNIEHPSSSSGSSNNDTNTKDIFSVVNTNKENNINNNKTFYYDEKYVKVCIIYVLFV
jgi:hypothetical protein